MMKISSLMSLAAISAALLVAGCTTPKPTSTTTPPPTGYSTPPAAASTIVPGSAEDLRVNVGDTVHFEYNAYDIMEGDKSTLQRQAAWLAKYPSVRITIEGNCDERGTREYNLALGARRANAVKEYLVSLGVSGARVETISYGKERPMCTESSESCYAQNRRGVTTISGGANS